MTEFQEFTQDAPNFVSMDRGELVTYAYGMFAAGTKADAENAKLREQIHWLKKGDILHVLTDQEYIDQCERERLMQVSIDALDKDNAKLRELVDGFTWCCGHHCGQECPLYDVSEPDYCRETSIKRELRIEVDDA